MTTPLSLVFILLGLVASARIRLSGVILGQPVSVPLLGIVAAIVLLAVTALVLVLLRLLLAEGLRLRPRVVVTA